MIFPIYEFLKYIMQYAEGFIYVVITNPYSKLARVLKITKLIFEKINYLP
jgi:malate/lactate dehydrogenase